jgi:hypothetical protein
VTIYFNNIIVFSKDSKLHNNYVQSVIDKLIKARITLKIKKCEFNTITIKYFKIIYSIKRL